MPLEMKYFVVKPRSKQAHDYHAMASREALRAYARAIGPHDEGLATNLLRWAMEESDRSKGLNLAARTTG